MQILDVRDLKNKYLGKCLYITSQKVLDDVFSKAQKESKHCWIDLETNSLDCRQGEILLNSVCFRAGWSVVFNNRKFKSINSFTDYLAQCSVSNQSLSFDMPWIYEKYGVEPSLAWCTETGAQFGWGELLPFKSLDYQSRMFLNTYLDKSVRDKFINRDPDEPETLEEVIYAAADTVIMPQLTKIQWNRINNINQLDFFLDYEMPCLEILTKSSYIGYPINLDYLKASIKDVEASLDKIKGSFTELYKEFLLKSDPGADVSDISINPRSREEIIKLLELTGIRTNSIKEEVMEDLFNKNPDNPVLKLYRNEYAEAKSYYEKYLKPYTVKASIDPEARIHPSIRTCINTGRMASKDPNIMATPAKGRSLIKAEQNCYIVSCDFSSYEFRACAADSDEEVLLNAFRIRKDLLPSIIGISQKFFEDPKTKSKFGDPDKFAKVFFEKKPEHIKLDGNDLALMTEFYSNDIHRLNAARMWKISPLEVTSAQRTIAKMLGYAVLYSITAESLQIQLRGEGLDFSIDEVKSFMALFSEAYPKIAESIRESNRQISIPKFQSPIRTEYWQETHLGRKRWFLFPKNKNSDYYREVLSANQRESYNHKFQGNNADALKIALPELNKFFKDLNKESDYEFPYEEGKYISFVKKNNYEVSRVLWPVHDEVNSNIEERHLEKTLREKPLILERAGEIATNFKVPMEIAVSYERVWPK